jgi:hypothetical protein
MDRRLLTASLLQASHFSGVQSLLESHAAQPGAVNSVHVNAALRRVVQLHAKGQGVRG